MERERILTMLPGIRMHANHVWSNREDGLEQAARAAAKELFPEGSKECEETVSQILSEAGKDDARRAAQLPRPFHPNSHPHPRSRPREQKKPWPTSFPGVVKVEVDERTMTAEIAVTPELSITFLAPTIGKITYESLQEPTRTLHRSRAASEEEYRVAGGLYHKAKVQALAILQGRQRKLNKKKTTSLKETTAR